MKLGRKGREDEKCNEITHNFFLNLLLGDIFDRDESSHSDKRKPSKEQVDIENSLFPGPSKLVHSERGQQTVGKERQEKNS